MSIGARGNDVHFVVYVCIKPWYTKTMMQTLNTETDMTPTHAENADWRIIRRDGAVVIIDQIDRCIIDTRRGGDTIKMFIKACKDYGVRIPTA